jgi:hypothetical protein
MSLGMIGSQPKPAGPVKIFSRMLQLSTEMFAQIDIFFPGDGPESLMSGCFPSIQPGRLIHNSRQECDFRAKARLAADISVTPQLKLPL